jgi:hypothetical protein
VYDFLDDFGTIDPKNNIKPALNNLSWYISKYDGICD